jgi:AAA+ ATPase superfamily predicted ATPase
MNLILDLLDSRSKDRYFSILTSIASGRNRLAQVAKAVKIKQSEASRDLAHLSDLGLVSKNGVFYRVDDPVLAFWIEKVYNKRKNLLVDGIFNRNELFESQVKKYITSFLDESEKDITKRLGELFSSFSNELVQIESRQLRLPHFTKVEIGAFADGEKYLAATFRGKSWIVRAYRDAATETDIVDYVRNMKSLEYKISNKIVIALGGIDENARLLAKELKISVWDTLALNNLLSAYAKFKVGI